MGIDFLTSGNWFNTQVDFLVFLQNLRTHIGPVFDGVFMRVTELGELFVPTLVMAIIYWCFDFKAGVFLFSLNSFEMLIAQLLKCTCCIYRPWVLSERVSPVQTALARSGGYSFPSGHSSMISSSAGGMAFLAWKNKPLFCFLVLIILLVMFSRLYLGVHTLQDVFAGPIVALFLIVIFNMVINYCEKDKTRYLHLLVISNILALLVLYFILTKNYPMDYDSGKLLVNPAKARYIAVVYSGWILGILNGVYLCARFFRFNPKDASVRARVIRAIIGGMILFVILYFAQRYFFEGEGRYSVTFLSMFSGGFFITAIYPLLFTKFSSK